MLAEAVLFHGASGAMHSSTEVGGIYGFHTGRGREMEISLVQRDVFLDVGEDKFRGSAVNLIDDDALDLALWSDLQQHAGDAISHAFRNATEDDVARRLGGGRVGDLQVLEFF